MHVIFRIVFIALFPIAAFAGSYEKAAKEKMKVEMCIIEHAFEVLYAPLHWKQAHLGWDLRHEVDEAYRKIDALENPTTKDFQQIVRQFFNSTRDYHAAVTFYSTEAASLPFGIRGVNGRYFLSYIDRSQLSASFFPCEIGDELILFNDIPAHEAVIEIENSEFGTVEEGTNRLLAEIVLTNRLGKMGIHVPKGPVNLLFRSNRLDKEYSLQLIWSYTPEKITLGMPQVKSLLFPKTEKLHAKKILEDRYFISPLAENILKGFQGKQGEENFHAVGSKKSFLPRLGKILWEADPATWEFDAYIFEGPSKQKIGYIRIPHYAPGLGFIEQFGDLLKMFQKQTDALVIDQMNNPGGSFFYLYTLASMLTNRPLQTPKHQMKITAQDIDLAVFSIPLLERVESDADAIEVLGTDLQGYPLNFQVSQFLLGYFRFLVEEWRQGKTLTSPYYVLGVDYINPHPNVQYTKPLLVLVNELDFSAADFFPAILQDNKRACIFGTKTAGAGGYLQKQEFASHFGIEAFTVTGSIATRSNSAIIENQGITPDITCQLVEEDFATHYQPFTQAILEAVQQLAPSKKRR